ncbi:MAG: Na/Pi cotransporter family protein [Clostridia bacterium]|nr:Na/Pi cotransporter family protein [Clostridia bacterium]
MTFQNVATLIGGIAMFIFGMNSMTDNLKEMAGGYLKKILAKLTEKRVVAVLVGAGLTALIQSSNAICSMAVGFVNAGLMQLERTVGIIIGAKIGTTITGQLIAFHISDYATILIFAGVFITMFIKNQKIKYFGNVIASLGILFLGLGMMSSAMAPLRGMESFQKIIASLENPILGVLFGVAFTAIMQSVSASVGILQMMLLAGAMDFRPALYIMLGMNIGASIAPILASIGGRKDAKRVAAIVVIIETLGALVFMAIILLAPQTVGLIQSTSSDPSRQMANANSLFSILMCFVTFPIANQIAWLSRKIIRGEDKEQEDGKLEYITEAGLSAAVTCIPQIDAEVRRMQDLTKQNLKIATDTFFSDVPYDKSKFMKVEKTIDFLNKAITDSLIRCSSLNLSEKDASHIGHLFHVTTDLERIGDHAENIIDYANRMIEEDKPFSQPAQLELKELVTTVINILNDACVHLFEPSQEAYNNIYLQEQEIDDLVDKMKDNHVERLHNRECHSSQGLIFVETLTDLERVADHALNIAQAANVRYYYDGPGAPPVNTATL